MSRIYIFLGNLEVSLLLLALLTHMSPTSVLILPPILFLMLVGPSSRLASPTKFVGFKRAVPLALQYFTYFILLALISALVAGGWSWTGRTWGAV